MRGANLSPLLGYACINTELSEKGIRCTRTVMLKSIKDLAQMQKIGLENLTDLEKILVHNEQNGHRFFRISSAMLPHAGNPQLAEINPDLEEYSKGNIDFAAPILARIGQYVKANHHRITCHPGQFAQLGTPRDSVFAQTIIDLQMHAKMFALMGLTPEDGSVMIIHGGGAFGSKKETIGRIQARWPSIDRAVSQYIVLENDEFTYSVEDLLPLSEMHNIPIVVDYFHHLVMTSLGRCSFDVYSPEISRRILDVWRRRKIVPKCHISSQKLREPGEKKDPRPGTHAVELQEIPAKLLFLARREGIDIMIESKGKENTLVDILRRYYDRKTDPTGKKYYTLKSRFSAAPDAAGEKK